MTESADEKPETSSPAPQSLVELLELPDGPRELAIWLLRHGQASLAEVVTQTGREATDCRAMLDTLRAKGVIEQTGDGDGARYRSHVGYKRGARIPGDDSAGT